MSARRVERGGRFLLSLRSAGVAARSPQWQAIRATERALADAEILPGPLDYEVSIPLVQFAWVRRLPGQNLWLYYRVREDAVYLIIVTRDPPVPLF